MANFKHYVITTRQVIELEGSSGVYNYKYEKQYTSADSAESFLRFGRYQARENIKKETVFHDPYFFDHIVNNKDEDEDFEGLTDSSIIGERHIEVGAGSEQFFNTLFNELDASRKDLLIFLFGFHNSIKKEMKHMRLLNKEFCTNDSSVGSILMISWPSQGLVGYSEEMNTDIDNTGSALAIFFLKLATAIEQRRSKNQYIPRINFMPQSMGHRIVSSMMTILKHQNQNIYSKVTGIFHRLILMSPDIEHTALSANSDMSYKHVPELGQRTYVFFSRQDPILKMNLKHVKHKLRLGLNGPSSNLPNVSVCNVIQQGQPPVFDLDETQRHRFFEFDSGCINLLKKIFSGRDDEFEREFNLIIKWNDFNT
jgi:esterase/lipase superfamily enzyme